MQIVFKAITGGFGHAPLWKGKCGNVWAREKSVAKTTELVGRFSSLGNVLAYRSKYLF